MQPFTPHSGGSADAVPSEQFSLNFEEIKVTYDPVAPFGQLRKRPGRSK